MNIKIQFENRRAVSKGFYPDAFKNQAESGAGDFADIRRWRNGLIQGRYRL